MFIKKIFFTIAFAFLLLACNDNKVSFEKIIIEKQTPKNEIDITINYSECKGSSSFANNFNQAIRTHIIDFVVGNYGGEINITSENATNVSLVVDAVIDSLMKEYSDLEEYMDQMPFFELFLNDTILLQNDKMISLESHTYAYLGGAHGIGIVSYLNFDAKSGELIPNDLLFTNIEEFTKIAEKSFRKKYQIPEQDSINEYGFWFEDDVFYIPDGIGFSENEVILVYNPYEVASYADSPVFIEVPKDEVKEFLRY